MKNIFVSSTFVDMQAERDLVQKRVLPALREKAREYGDAVGVIDLRWGVDTSTLKEEEEVAAKVLTVCLREIEHSHPYMLVFIGERYGTMMPAKQIQRTLLGKEDRYVTEDYDKSITALEVEYGALAEKYGKLEKCIFCFREPVVHMLDGEERDLYAEHDAEGERKLAALKEKIQTALGEKMKKHLITYSCKWDSTNRRLVEFTSDGEPLETVLTERFTDIFREEWQEHKLLNWQDREQLAFQALSESKLQSFAGREELLKDYCQCAKDATGPIILRGEVGSGKTAIMCKLAERLKAENHPVFTFFSGAGSRSTTAESLVMQMVYYLENILGIKDHFSECEVSGRGTKRATQEMLRLEKAPERYDKWIERLEELCFRLPENEKVFFFIDAVDQLFADDHTKNLDFLMSERSVQFIVSCTNDFELPLDARGDRCEKTIPSLNDQDAEAVAEGILRSNYRDFYKEIKQALSEKRSTGNPLYISLLIQRLLMMDMEELYAAGSESQIIAVLESGIKEMPEKLEDAVWFIIRNAIEKVGRDKTLLYPTLQYLAVSRNGLRMQDLQEIFAAQEQNFSVLDVSTLMKYLDTFFYTHDDGRVDFTHKVIRQGVRQYLEDNGLREACEETVKEYLSTLPGTDPVREQEGMYFARIRQDEKFARELIAQATEEQPELVTAIAREAVADGGEFYCKLISDETECDSPMCEFFLTMVDRLGLEEKEAEAKLKILNALKAYENNKNTGAKRLDRLVRIYYEKGRLLADVGRYTDALAAHEAALEIDLKIYEKDKSEDHLYNIIVAYVNIGFVLRALGDNTIVRESQRQAYYKRSFKNLKNAIKNYNKLPTKNARDLSACYNHMGRSLENLGNDRFPEALGYHEKALEYAHEFDKQQSNDESRSNLSSCYYGLASVLRKMDDKSQRTRVLDCYDQAITIYTELCEKPGWDRSWEQLVVIYSEMGDMFSHWKQPQEALEHCKKALERQEQLHDKQRSLGSLRSLYACCERVALALMDNDALVAAQQHADRVLKYAKEIREKENVVDNLSYLLKSNAVMGHVLKRQEEFSDAITYYIEACTHSEKLYIEGSSRNNLENYAICCRNVCETWCANPSPSMKDTKTALTYCEQALKNYKKLYEWDDKEKNIKDSLNYLYYMACQYNNMGYIYMALEEKTQKEKDRRKLIDLAVENLEEAVKHLEELCRKEHSDRSRQLLSTSEKNLADAREKLKPKQTEKPRDPKFRHFK